MNRVVSLGEERLGLRLIAKQPILSITIILSTSPSEVSSVAWVPARRALGIRPSEALNADQTTV